MEWPFVASLLHLFVHALSTVVQCGVVLHQPCWRIWRKSSFEWQEQSSRIRPCRTCQRSNRLVSPLCRAKARTLPILIGLLWQLSIGKGPPALQASLVPCAPLRSTRFPHSFRFPSASSVIVSSLVVLSLSNCPHLEQAAFSCHLFCTSLSSFRSAVRRYFVSDMFSYSYGLSWLLSLIPFVGFPIFICIFVFMFQHPFCSLFSYSFCVCVCVCVVVVVVVSFSQRKGPRLASCYWPILFKHYVQWMNVTCTWMLKEGLSVKHFNTENCTWSSRALGSPRTGKVLEILWFGKVHGRCLADCSKEAALCWWTRECLAERRDRIGSERTSTSSSWMTVFGKT